MNLSFQTGWKLLLHGKGRGWKEKNVLRKNVLRKTEVQNSTFYYPVSQLSIKL
jgi:hypothetical protein